MKEQNINSTSNENLIEGTYIDMGTSNEFEAAFARSVSEGLEAISEAVAPILRIFLSNAMTVDCVMTKSRMGPEDAKPLEEGLEKILGFGAKVFEKKMLTNLQARLGLCYDIDRNFEFSKEVEKARNLYLEKFSNQIKKATEDSSNDSIDTDLAKEI